MIVTFKKNTPSVQKYVSYCVLGHLQMTSELRGGAKNGEKCRDTPDHKRLIRCLDVCGKNNIMLNRADNIFKQPLA